MIFRQGTPAHIDPVVAFIHRGGWSQVKYRIGNGCIRDTRRHLPSRRTKLRRHPRAVAVLLGNGWVAASVVQGGCGVVRDVRNHRVSRSEREARAVVGRAGVAANTDIPVAGSRARATTPGDDGASAV